jgi:hypothetical protein
MRCKYCGKGIVKEYYTGAVFVHYTLFTWGYTCEESPNSRHYPAQKPADI